MILFSFYLVVSAALLVQSYPREENFGKNVDPFLGLEGILPQSKHSNAKQKLSDMKNALSRVLQGVVAPLKPQKRRTKAHRHQRKVRPCANAQNDNCKKQTVEGGQSCDHNQGSCKPKEPEWDKWSDWSPCSVSCGRGREIRWRNCLHNCDEVETEMQEKKCQLPACSNKLFGLFNL